MEQKVLPEHGTRFTSGCKRCCLLAALVGLSISARAAGPFASPGGHVVSNRSIGRPVLQTVKGRVTDEKGEGLPGVNVLVKGTQQGTSSDSNGNFTIEAPGPDAVLVFSFVGYQPREITVGSSSVLEVKLAVDTKSLDEVVVTALGIKKEVKSVGYSVTKVEGSAFTKTRETNIGNSLAGKVAGVNVSAAATGPAGSSRITIRGNTSLTGDNAPLFIINGIPMNNTKFGKTQGDNPDWGDNISSINPDDVEDMTVLKGAAAAALYGSRAKNGAIIITTKSGKGNKGIGIEFNSNNTVEVPYFIWDLQKEYGQGYNGVKPSGVGVAAAHGQNHWGAPYDGSMVVQLDGVERPYSYVKDQVLKDFYGNGYTSSNNIAFTGGGDKGNFRLAVTDMRNKGIIPNAKMLGQCQPEHQSECHQKHRYQRQCRLHQRKGR